MKISLIIVLSCFLLISCSKRRIDLIEDTFGIHLPEKYEVLKNTTLASGFAGSDFEINVELKFQAKEFKELEKELPKIISFKEENSQRYYKDAGNESGFMEIDSKEKLLKFRFIHI